MDTLNMVALASSVSTGGVIDPTTGVVTVGNVEANSSGIDLLQIGTNMDRASISLSSMVQHIEHIENRQKVWTNGLYARANEELYSILASCLQLIQLKYRALINVRDAAVKEVCEKRGIVDSRDTPISTKVVWVVFGMNIGRRRTSVYSICLRAAVSQSVAPADFALWVKNNGGVENCREAKSESAGATLSTVTKAAQTLKYLDHSSGLGNFVAEGVMQASARANDGKPVVIVAIQQTDGTHKALGVIAKSVVVDLALASLYAANKDAIHNFQVEEELRALMAA